MRRAGTGWVWASAALLVGGAPALAGEERGNATVDRVDAGRGHIVIGDATYVAGDYTQIENEQGARLSLADVPSIEGGASPDEAAVWFEAGEASGTAPRPLLRLELTGSLPR